jgi:hypothetical protein
MERAFHARGIAFIKSFDVVLDDLLDRCQVVQFRRNCTLHRVFSSSFGNAALLLSHASWPIIGLAFNL